MENTFCKRMQTHLTALYRFVWVHTYEEQRAIKEIIRSVETLRKNTADSDNPVNFCYGEWSFTKGIKAWSKPSADDIAAMDDADRPAGIDANPEETRDPIEAIRWVDACRQKIVVVFKDLHSYLHDPAVCRTLRDFLSESESMSRKQHVAKIIIAVSPVLDIPIELERSVTVMDFDLPSDKEFGARLDTIVQTINSSKIKRAKRKNEEPELLVVSKEDHEETVKSGRGLTMNEFDNAVAKSLIVHQGVSCDIIQEEKKQIVMKNGILEQLAPAEMNDVGGMDSLKDWLTERQAGWTEEGRQYGLTSPRGILLLGVQGCGKSLIGKAIASNWRLPLYKLDVGKLFNQTVGSSESRTRNVLKTIEAVAPAVMLIDEIDKGLSGVHSSNMSDGGTTARVVGTILTWMQEHRSDVFIVATANSIEGLPPELLRKGRFSEVFFVDLPSEEEREETFKIHLRKIGREGKSFKFDTKRFAKITEHFSGAEIEAVIESALIKSFPDRQLKDAHIIGAINSTVPLWKTKREDITALIDWVGYDKEKEDGVRARFASSRNTKEEKGSNIFDLKKSE